MLAMQQCCNTCTFAAGVARQLQHASAQLGLLRLELAQAQQLLVDTAVRNDQLQQAVLELQPQDADSQAQPDDDFSTRAAAMVNSLLGCGDQQEAGGDAQAASGQADSGQTLAAHGTWQPCQGSEHGTESAPTLLAAAAPTQQAAAGAPAPGAPTPAAAATTPAPEGPVFVETDADIRSLQRGLWCTDECRRKSTCNCRMYRLLPSSLPPDAMGPPAPHDLYSYLQLKDAIRNCTACRNCRDKIIRHVKRLDGLDLPCFNPLVLVHGEVLAAIRAQSARVSVGRAGALGNPAPRGPAAAGRSAGRGPAGQQEQQEPRTLFNLGVGSLVRLALQLQAAMCTEPCTEFFAATGPDSF